MFWKLQSVTVCRTSSQYFCSLLVLMGHSKGKYECSQVADELHSITKHSLLSIVTEASLTNSCCTLVVHESCGPEKIWMIWGESNLKRKNLLAWEGTIETVSPRHMPLLPGFCWIIYSNVPHKRFSCLVSYSHQLKQGEIPGKGQLFNQFCTKTQKNVMTLLVDGNMSGWESEWAKFGGWSSQAQSFITKGISRAFFARNVWNLFPPKIALFFFIFFQCTDFNSDLVQQSFTLYTAWYNVWQ